MLFAGDKDDLLDASTGEGGNRIYAGNGDDTLILGEGDRAFGGAGDDRFFATSGGDNTITGGEGTDQFWIASAEVPDATNTITDFTSGEDVIGIAGFNISFGDVTLTQQGHDALNGTDGNDLALLQDVDITALGSADFAFG
ncbi:MAG: M10 family metallopeptidase C-terminal domain-containing protein [Pleurocapsa sp.]